MSQAISSRRNLRQEQLLVPADSATFDSIGTGKHFGEVFCPFCSKLTVVLGPKSGMGTAWLHETCRHSQGITAGHGYDITVLFNGYDYDMEGK